MTPIFSSIVISLGRSGFLSIPPMRTDNLPRENDGVQLILQSFISNSVPDSLLQKILTTMWYIWKARNDNRFQRKTWTPMQVHNAVAAHINTHLQAQQAGNEAATTQSTQPLQLTDLADHSQQGAPSTSTDLPTDYGVQFTSEVPSMNQARQPPQMHAESSGVNTSLLQLPMTNRYTINTPALLPGTRCYVDASTLPDHPTMPPRQVRSGNSHC